MKRFSYPWMLMSLLAAGYFLAEVSQTHAQVVFPANNPFVRPAIGVGPFGPVVNPAFQNPVAPVFPVGNLNPYFTGPTPAYNPAFPNTVPPFPYFGGYYDPYGGYLRGAAEVINAQGNYLNKKQEAWLKMEQVKQAKIETRQKAFDEWLYEQKNTPKAEEIRQQAVRELLSRSLTDPPMTDINSATALNSILGAIEGLSGRMKETSPINLDQELLKKVNITKGTVVGNTLLLRNEGRITWPNIWEKLGQSPSVRQVMDKTESSLRAAYQQVRTGTVEATTLSDLETQIRNLQGELNKTKSSLHFNEHLEANNFIKNLQDSLKILREPDAREFLGGINTARGRTAQEVVRHMMEKGLRFAPATGESGDAYLMMHRALVAYYNAMASN
jgi:hypothetical protein